MNHLKNESSPYLLQHVNNPVDWYPWGPEALEKARAEDKMLLISVGYSACHWCHVMEHESFEDTTVAAIMNANFVCIKVDREERPDVDDVYMTACHMSGGRGCGWPLNAFALPDGRPVWAGSYFPKEQWIAVLEQFKTKWAEDKSTLNDFAQKLTDGIQAQDELIPGAPQELKVADAHAMAKNLIAQIDLKYGGRKVAPKFPSPSNYRYLLNYHVMTGDQEALDAVEITLDHMANGGIYDQLGGGFSRYSTDDQWLVPHFEKMLYDNSQLLSLYSQAYQITERPLYKKVLKEIAGWLDREMTDPSGGFYTSLDADSEGVEGKYYVWEAEEIDALLPAKDAKIYKDYYSVSTRGNWEEKNILHRAKSTAGILRTHTLTEDALSALIARSNEILLKTRAKRVRPGLDDKILTSLNALMLTGLANAYSATGDQIYLDRALKNARFIKKNLIKEDGRIDRVYKNGETKINGFLDDYAFVIEAYIQLYQVTFDESWLQDAKTLTDYALNHFYDSESYFFNYTSDLDPALVARKRELGDGVVPGSNSVMGRNLNFLSHYFDNADYSNASDMLLYALIDPIIQSKQTGFYSNWANLFLEKLHPTYEIAIVGDDALEQLNKMQLNYLPNALYMGGKNEGSIPLLKDKLQPGRTMIYVCQNKTCQLPVEATSDALEQIKYLD